MTGIVQHWDHPANSDRYGPLFNGRTHQIQLRVRYELNEKWSFGGTATAQFGGPITAYSVTGPNDSKAAASFTTIGSGSGSSYTRVDNCSGPLQPARLRFHSARRVWPPAVDIQRRGVAFGLTVR